MQQTLHNWVTALPGGERVQHASMSTNNSHNKKKSAVKKTKKVKCVNKKYNSKKHHHLQSTDKKSSGHPTQRNMMSFTTSSSSKYPSIFGESIIGKGDGTCRIVSQNVGCLEMRIFANNKIRTAKEWLYNHHVDICGWQELGFANHKFQRHEKLHERMHDNRRSAMRISTGTNKHDDVNKFQ